MVEVKLHDIGEGMTEADINCYLVKPGDFVKLMIHWLKSRQTR